MKFLDDIRDKSIQVAETLNAAMVLPRHLLLALIAKGGEGVELLKDEGIDPQGLEEVLAKYGRQEIDKAAGRLIGAGVSNVLVRVEELAKGYREEPGPEFFLWALSEDEEFLDDDLIQAIGIDWEEIGRSMRRRIDARHASHPSWSQALIADPGLNAAGVHKSTFLTVEQRFEAARDSLVGIDGVEVVTFDGLLVEEFRKFNNFWFFF